MFNEYKLDAWLRLADRLCLLPVELDSDEDVVNGTACMNMWDAVLVVSRCPVIEIEAPEAVPDGFNVWYFGG
jgi:hypothetical protein